MQPDIVVDLLDEMGFGPLGWHHDLRTDWIHGPAVEAYQWGFCGADRQSWLKPDGIAGPITQAALDFWGTRLSNNFLGREFIDRRAGITRVDRNLVAALQVLRGRIGPVGIVSAYRTSQTNEIVGGAKYSQHLYGLAADIRQRPHIAEVVKLKVFSGIGTNKDGRVVHLDVRHVVPRTNRTPGARVERPARWTYS